MTVLEVRFGTQAETLETELKAIDDEERLKELLRHAATCPLPSTLSAIGSRRDSEDASQ